MYHWYYVNCVFDAMFMEKSHSCVYKPTLGVKYIKTNVWPVVHYACVLIVYLWLPLKQPQSTAAQLDCTSKLKVFGLTTLTQIKNISLTLSYVMGKISQHNVYKNAFTS